MHLYAKLRATRCYFCFLSGGARRDRTADLLHAMQALSQLSYSPENRARTLVQYGDGVNCYSANQVKLF